MSLFEQVSRWCFGFALLGLFTSPAPARAADTLDQKTPPLKGLLITGGCCHDYERQKEIITEGLSQRANIVWDVIHEGDPKDRTHQISIYARPDWSKGYDIVVHNECFGAVEDVDFVQRIVRGHTETGVAGVVIHCSMHTYRAAPTDEWRKLVGVTSRRHEKGNRRLDVVNVAPEHPIMAGFPKSWKTPNGELYIIENIWPETTPLATAYSPETESDQLCIWTNRYGKARVFGTTLGHHNETMMSDEWLDTVARGLLWACDKLGDDGQPLPGYTGTGKGPLSFQKKIAEGGEPTPAKK